MGFYLELNRRTPNLYAENEVPSAFFALYAIAGFALVCMFASAYALLGDLFESGSWFDRGIVLVLSLSVPTYLVLGVKLFSVRKFVRWEKDTVFWGYTALGKTWWEKSLKKEQIEAIELSNRVPTPNLAPHHHEDSQYYIRGHWQVILQERGGKRRILDKHTERGALEALHSDLNHWLKS